MFTAKLDDVTLVPMAKEHALALFNIVRRDRRYLGRWQNWPRTIVHLDDMYRMIQHAEQKVAQNNGFDCTIFYKGQIVGKIGLVYINADTRATEIGYWQAKNAQGKGIMTRATHLVTCFALTTLGLDRVYIRCAQENVKSAAIPARLGYTYEGVLPEKVFIHKKFYPEVRYVMTAQTWLHDRMIYHILPRAMWDEAVIAGEYCPPSLLKQGYIHFANLSQILKVANAVYHNRDDVMLLAVDVRQLRAPLRYESPDVSIPAQHRAGEVFPHLYGALNLASVMRVDALPKSDSGAFQLPAYLDKWV